ncbi:kinesin-like protein KIF20A [Pollicipes pollicipes]|uniref:kinesin-like protein KIF20A n=1 Tax=Pollicipes pollicipes TaxID=41117 RepID=UPI0018852C36|nr:kinesin-like protein KIF20A [Pollicipes pollicipes]
MAFARPSASDVSYLQARVSGYTGRARASSALLPGLAPARRDLTAELEQQATAGTALRVFLRVRPQLDGDCGDDTDAVTSRVLEIPNNVHLVMNAPKDSATYKNGMNGNGKLAHRYTFTHIFRPETSQQQLFNQTTLNHITEFINGHSCLLFTYGATNSGKTYTAQGSPEQPGLLPRALDVIFNSVGDQLYARLDIQPRGFGEVCRVSARDEQAAQRLKRDTLRLGCQPESAELGASHGSEDSLAASSLYRSQESLAGSMESLSDLKCPEIEARCREPASVSMENQRETRFSVWVSFVEIYNEYVYDLLEKIPSSQKRRTVLHLGLDKKGNTFVKGLRHVQVRTADEACQVLRAGRQNLHFASNRLNHNSSRSHCVFTVKLIRMLDTDNPSVARISMLSVCDLAGSERVEKTLALGQRMKEAGNINTSLMVLGRCMKAMRQNQTKTAAAAAGGPALVPYRDSKLTRLFQSYFCGQAARVTMIVNVSPSPVVFDETIQVLKFSALAKQVSIQPVEKRRAPSRFSTMVRRSVQVAAAAVGAAIGRPRPLLDVTALDETQGDEHQNLLDLVEKLRHELVETKRENAGLEARIRQELCEEFAQHMVQIEKDWQDRMQETERYMESRAELQMNEVAKSLRAKYSRKRRRTSASDDDGGDADEADDDEADELAEAQERAPDVFSQRRSVPYRGQQWLHGIRM